jgi:hypothetical protein
MNPLILKGIRENLRTKHLIAAGLFSLIVCSTVYLTSYLKGSEGKYSQDPETNTWVRAESSAVNGARNAFTFLLALQGFYLMFLGTGPGCFHYRRGKRIRSTRLSAYDSHESPI